jgi:hypothetical protein
MSASIYYRLLVGSRGSRGFLRILRIPRSQKGLIVGAAAWLPPSGVPSPGASTDLPIPGLPYLLARYGKVFNILPRRKERNIFNRDKSFIKRDEKRFYTQRLKIIILKSRTL